MKQVLFVYCWFAYLICPVALLAGSLGTTAGCVSNPPDFSKLTYYQASDAVSEEMVDIVLTKSKPICPEYTTNLVNLLRHGDLDNDRKVLGVFLLGELRPTNANSIIFLIDNIDLKASRIDPPSRLPRWGPYPAEEALIKIGKPALDLILDVLPNEGKDLRRHLMCEVLQRVEGKDTAERQIREKLVGEADSMKKGNLESAITELEK